MSSCFTLEEVYAFLGYVPVQGFAYVGKPIGGSLNVDELERGRLVMGFHVDDLPDQAATFSGGIDFEGLNGAYPSQLQLRLGARYSGKLQDIDTCPGGTGVGVGTGGAIFAFNGDECFEPINPPTTEDFRTVTYSEPLGNTWTVGGDNGALFYSGDRINWMALTVPGLPAGTHFFDSMPFAHGTAMIADERIVVLTPGAGGGISAFQVIGIDKRFKAIAPWGDYFLALAEDTVGGGTVLLELTASSFDFVPQFGPVYGNKYCNILAHGDWVYLAPYDEQGNSARSVEIRNFANGQLIALRALPVTLEEYQFVGDKVYFAGLTPWNTYQIYCANRDFTGIRAIAELPPGKTIKSAECLLRFLVPSWSMYGEDCDPITPGIQFGRYWGGERRTETVAGTTGTGTIYDSIRVNEHLALAVGNQSGEALIVGDDGRECFAIAGNGLSGRLVSLEYDHVSGICIAGNMAGGLFSTNLTGRRTRAQLDQAQWVAESPPGPVDAWISTASSFGFFYRAQDDGNGAANDIFHRSVAGTWTSQEYSLGLKVTSVYHDPVLERLYATADTGLGFIANDGQQGEVFPEGLINFEGHHVQGDRRGGRMHVVTGEPGDLDGPCPMWEVIMNGVATTTPPAEFIGYTAPGRLPRLHYSANFFVCLGNRGLFSLFPRRFRDWPEYARYMFGSAAVLPQGDFDGNGVSNIDQAIGGTGGPHPRIEHVEGFTRVELPVFPFYQGYWIDAEESGDLTGFQHYGGIPYILAPGGVGLMAPTDLTHFYRFNLRYDF